jgi:hypothetical protein
MGGPSDFQTFTRSSFTNGIGQCNIIPNIELQMPQFLVPEQCAARSD